MGIKQIENYQVSDHAQERLTERFMTSKSHVRAWLTNFNMTAQKVKDQNNGTELWRSNDVFMVIDASKKTIVTVYPKPTSDHIVISDIVTDYKAQADLNTLAFKQIQKAQIKFGEDMYVPLMNLDLLAHQLRSSEDMANSSEIYEKLVSGLARVQKQEEKVEAYISDMQKLID
ncbi:hypothetical protein JOC36_000829 [Weissella uvarum]|uniref:hypothetical protein n=1 Tax=Weissella uvarum TaxID=1479233 RepID=UPI00195FFA83|nr:hypothetical protein [Weissella uvarum]MBM7617280.1 hypothetical protein [Weissella uvarum]MCM0595216.1 hypothetical protein [Weissella uvarum]